MNDLYNRVSRRRRRGQRGFTLIELLVVIAILSVLAAIVIINVTGVKSNAQDTACAADTQTIQTAVDGYYDAQSPTNVYPVEVGGKPADTADPGAGALVDIAELTSKTNPYLQDTPPADETFTYTGNPVGSVQGSVNGGPPCGTATPPS